MIVWLAPAALAGLLALAGPVAVHMLRRQQARRIVVPSVRFVPGLDRSAARSRYPSDVLLLLLRAAIVACGAVALAGPLVLHSARTAAWAQRTARVVIVDTSDSVRGPISGEAIAAELASGDPVLRIDSDIPGTALNRAAAWLAQSPPSRREIVVLSDFQHGAVTEESLAALPPEIGVRLVPFRGENELRREVPGVPILTADVVADADVRLDANWTAARYRISSTAPDGLILTPASDAGAIARLLRVVSAAGAPAPSPAQPIVVRFRGAEPLESSPARRLVRRSLGEGEPEPSAAWAFGAAQRFLRSAQLPDVPVRIVDRGSSLVIEADADPRSLAAAQVVKAALDARVDPRLLAEEEPERIAAATLASWSRESAPPETGAWRQSDESDGRWLWLIALVLLGAETLVRRSPAAASRRTEAHAA